MAPFRIKLTLAYEGTDFFGWQKSKEGLTIEEALEEALAQVELLLLSPLEAASRTDRGVHALSQVVSFTTSTMRDPYPLLMGLNRFLPSSIRIRSVEFVPLPFHPTLDNHGKEYLYKIANSSFFSPLERNFYWQIKEPLNLSLIELALPHFIGTHSFQAFCNQKKNEFYTSYEKTIHNLSFSLHNEKIIFSIKGNSFLYKMVRNIVGTLVDVGREKIKPENIPLIFKSCDRKQAGVTAPAHGLYLNEIFY